jgi:hypothetical protein
MTVEPHRTKQGTAGLGEVALRSVWHSLECGKWISRAALKEASGTDDDNLTCIIAFLTRWEFVDVKPFPELLLRRKPGSFSPMEIYEVLRRLADQSAPPTSRSRIAERVACRACSSRELDFVGPNEVECTRCREKQWYAIEATAGTKRKSPMHLRLLNQISSRLGLLQRHRDSIVV